MTKAVDGRQYAVDSVGTGRRWRARLILLATIAAYCLLPTTCCLAARRDELMKKVRLDQKLNAQVPLDISLKDETGRTVQLHQFFGKKPVMLILIQYRCTMLCSEEMKALALSLKEMQFTVGKQFNLITVSIDHRETPDLAAHYREGYLKDYGRPEAATGWHFLTGDERSIRRLSDAIGFHFAYDAETDQFMHPDGVIVLTPEGRVARYFFRLEYPARALRLALVEAADRKIGTPLDGLWLLCYHYNPVTGRYNLALMGVLRLAALGTVLLLGMGVGVMSLRSRRSSIQAFRRWETDPERLSARTPERPSAGEG
jgi:protein SCO1/2